MPSAHGGISEIVRRFGRALVNERTLSPRAHQVLGHIERCRTPALGGHLHVCDQCGHQTPVYNGCRDRHCAGCQSTDQYRWLLARRKRNPQTSWFHVVFTLPEPLRLIARLDPARIYALLFEAASDTLLTLARDPHWLGATPAITTVLHTWTRELHLHPHLHCIVSAGALSSDDTRWIAIERPYLFPAAVMSALFRGKFLAGLDRIHRAHPLRMPHDDPAYLHRIRDSLHTTKWVVYAKAPFGDGDALFRYLGRYTHRVGISNARIRRITDVDVTFVTRNGNEVTVPGVAFLKRFSQHVLPIGFTRVRHYGLFAASNVHTRLERARRLLGAVAAEPTPPRQTTDNHWTVLLPAMTGFDPMRCPRCQKGCCERRPLPTPDSPISERRDTS
jgi:hypothetical protein